MLATPAMPKLQRSVSSCVFSVPTFLWTLLGEVGASTQPFWFQPGAAGPWLEALLCEDHSSGSHAGLRAADYSFRAARMRRKACSGKLCGLVLSSVVLLLGFGSQAGVQPSGSSVWGYGGGAYSAKAKRLRTM